MFRQFNIFWWIMPTGKPLILWTWHLKILPIRHLSTLWNCSRINLKTKSAPSSPLEDSSPKKNCKKVHPDDEPIMSALEMLLPRPTGQQKVLNDVPITNRLSPSISPAILLAGRFNNSLATSCSQLTCHATSVTIRNIITGWLGRFRGTNGSGWRRCF